MSGDLIPTGDTPGFIDKLNLPKLIAGPAGEAISRLVAGAVDIPAAWMNQFAQGIRDKTEAKTVVSKAVANAAAQLVKQDPEIIQRAAYTLLSKQITKQSNRESVAQKTIEILNDEQAANPEQQAHPVDPDWLNVFERYAEDASSERLQELWARVLSGQIRTPKAFSLQTLRFVSELDEETAKLFEKFAPRVVNADFIPYPPKEGQEFTELLTLENAGLITGPTGHLVKTFKLKKGIAGLRYKSHLLRLAVENDFDCQVENVLLTKIGREIYSILTTLDDIECARTFVEKLPKPHISTAAYLPNANPEQETILWQKTIPPSSDTTAA